MVAAIQLLFPDAHCPQLADEQIPALARGQDSLHEQARFAGLGDHAFNATVSST